MNTAFYRGIVVSAEDPQNLRRARVQIPQLTGDDSLWAFPMSPQDQPPDPGERVWVTFESGDLNYPVWASYSAFSSEDPPVSVLAGPGLTGGGPLTANVTLNADFGSGATQVARGSELATLAGQMTRLAGTQTTPNSDWNQAVTQGFYMQGGGSNQPPGETAWTIGVVMVHNNLWITQLVFTFATTQRWYTRQLVNGTWGAWQALGNIVANRAPTDADVGPIGSVWIQY